MARGGSASPRRKIPARFLALSAEPAPGFAQDFQDRGLLSASRSSYSALWSASARLAVSAASFLTCSAASSLAPNFGAHAVRGGMLALNACHRAQLGFAPARFAGARWEPAQQIRRTSRLPGFRQRPPHRPLCSGVCHAAYFPTPSSKSFWGGGCSTRGEGLCRFRLSSLPVGLVLQVLHQW